MSIKGMLFNTDMVRAILDGSKTVTRRVIKKMDQNECGFDQLRIVSPPCCPGDVLYVRETFFYFAGQYVYRASAAQPELWDGMWRPSIHMPRTAARIWLRVTDVRVERLHEMSIEDMKHEGCCESCNRCVRYYDFCGASVTQSEDCKEDWKNPSFPRLWDSTIKPADRERYGWAANPWVWRIAFERCKKPEEV